MPRIVLGLLGLVAALVLAAAPVAAQQTIRLGAYHFPPYAVNTADGMGGLVVDLARLMNEAQDEFVFEVVPISAQDRYAEMADGRIDAIAFESLAWGWDGMAVEASAPFMEGAEVYVARAGPGIDQSFFDDIGGRSIAAVYGYHYGFAGFNADPAWLHRNFTVVQPLSPVASLYYVLEGRVELAVVPALFLEVFLREHPEHEGRFLVGDRVDQSYSHTIVSRSGGPLPVAEIDAILEALRRSGALDRMMADDLP